MIHNIGGLLCSESQEQYKACVVIQRIQEYRGTFTRIEYSE